MPRQDSSNHALDYASPASARVRFLTSIGMMFGILGVAHASAPVSGGKYDQAARVFLAFLLLCITTPLAAISLAYSVDPKTPISTGQRWSLGLSAGVMTLLVLATLIVSLMR